MESVLKESLMLNPGASFWEKKRQDQNKTAASITLDLRKV
jgi:hypothetical protein